MANMLLGRVWKRHQILSLVNLDRGLPRGCFLMGSLSPFESGVHCPTLDLRSRTYQGQHAFLKRRHAWDSSCMTWWRKAFYLYLLKEQDAGMGWVLTPD